MLWGRGRRTSEDIFDSLQKTLARSQRHPLALAGFAGIGAAIAIQDVASRWDAVREPGRVPAASLLAAPAAIIFFLLTGLIFVFTVPAELPANWVFLIIGERKCDVAQSVARRSMLIMLAPVVAVVATTYSAAWGSTLGLEHAAFVFATSLALIEVLVMDYRKIPFTCSFSSAKYNMGTVLAVYSPAFVFFSPGLASVEHWALSSSRLVAFFILLAVFAAAAMGLRWYGRELELQERSLPFADEREPIVPLIELR
jgi:hypothetical protein